MNSIWRRSLISKTSRLPPSWCEKATLSAKTKPVTPRKSTWQRPSPFFGLECLLSELCGATNDESRYIHLSDGGHFENLGIYELVKRRCKYVLACDASEDQKYAFGNLGNAIRKCREDLGVEIRINTDAIRLQGSDKHCICHCAAF